MSENFDTPDAEQGQLFDTQELALKRGMRTKVEFSVVLMRFTEVLTLGPLGPISAAACEWLVRNQALVAALHAVNPEAQELVTPEQKKARGDRLAAMQKAALEKRLTRSTAEAQPVESVAEVRMQLHLQALKNTMKNTAYGVVEDGRARRFQDINERLQRKARAIGRGVVQRQWYAQQRGF